MLSPLAQERVQAEGSLCSVLHLFSPLLPALEVENIKSALFDSGLVLVYSFILGPEYFRTATSAYFKWVIMGSLMYPKPSESLVSMSPVLEEWTRPDWV